MMSETKKCIYCGKAASSGVSLEMKNGDTVSCCSEACHDKAYRFLHMANRFRWLFGLLSVIGLLPFIVYFAGMDINRFLLAGGIMLVAAVLAIYPFPRKGALEISTIQRVLTAGRIMAVLVAIAAILFGLGIFG